MAKLSPEERARVEKCSVLLIERGRMLEQARICLEDMLAVPEQLLDRFESNFPPQPPVQQLTATAEDIAGLSLEVRELSSVLERLQSRCDSDGLMVALRHIAASDGQSMRSLANEISSRGGRQAPTNSMALADFHMWLSTMRLSYTPSGMAFLAQSAGTNMRMLKEGKKINLDRLVYAFEKVPFTPINW